MSTINNINIVNNYGNFNQVNGNSPLNSFLPTRLPAEICAPQNPMGKFLQNFQTGFAQGLLEGFANGLQSALNSPTCPCHPPVPEDSGHPAGSLTKDDKGVITTPGGYKIEATKQHEWTITGPDGKTTRIWGDPHVDENNDGKTEWDFKRDTTFVLGDGTKINVTTKPWANDMTVTGGLEIISGNDRVVVSDVDKGKGKVGEITQDGFAHANSFGGKDVVVMGQNAAEWSFQGKKIVGSEKGGEVFKLGQELAPLVHTTQQYGGPQQWSNDLFNQLSQILGNRMPTSSPTSPFGGFNPYAGNGFGGAYDRGNHLQNLGQAFSAIGQMMQSLARLLDLTNSLRRPVFG